MRIVSATDVFSSIDSITSRSLAYRSLTTPRRTGMGAGAGMAGSGLTSATVIIMATSSYSKIITPFSTCIISQRTVV